MSYCYEISTRAEFPGHVDPEWRDSIAGTTICSRCWNPLSRTRPLDVVVVEAPQRASLNVIYGIGGGVIEERFLKYLASRGLDAHLQIGSIYLRDGSRVRGMRTFVGKELVYINDDSEPYQSRSCPECGRFEMGPMQGNWYVVEPDGGLPRIAESSMGQLIVSASEYTWLSHIRLRKAAITAIPLFSSPLR